MQWDIIIGPVIGAAIGYVTNRIAVSMLFHPINPVYIGKFRLPFTPGIIPKGKGRFAKAIGNVVGNNLLNTESIKNTLLSPEKEQQIGKELDIIIQKLEEDHNTLETRMADLMGDAARDKLETNLVQGLTEKINDKLTAMNLGQIVAGEVTAAIQEKVQGTMLAMFIKPAALEPIEEAIRERINQYIEENGRDKVNDLIQEEYTKLSGRTVSDLAGRLNTESIKGILLKAYRMLITNYSEKIIVSLNLSKIAEEKVNAMDSKEVEELVLTIMKKELGAIVNLGAVIGFILGMVNLLF